MFLPSSTFLPLLFPRNMSATLYNSQVTSVPDPKTVKLREDPPPLKPRGPPTRPALVESFSFPDATWYHGPVPREQVESMLKNEPDGTCLFRCSANASSLILSLMFHGVSYHFLIKQWNWLQSPWHDGKPGRTFSIEPGPHFTDMDKLIQFYSTTPTKDLPIRLGKVIPKK